MSYQFSADTVAGRRAELIELVRGRVIVSAQAPDGHAMRDTHTLTHVAQACVAGGAPAIRCGGYGGITDVASIRAAVDVPVFGLTKEGTTGVYITPTRESVRSLERAGAHVICADATPRPRPDGSTFADLVATAHDLGVLIMADCSTPQEVADAVAVGADIVSTTLAGYTEFRSATPGPDLECLREARELIGPEPFLIGEGRFHDPSQVREGLAAGADAIIIGTAITDPGWITARFEAAGD